VYRMPCACPSELALLCADGSAWLLPAPPADSAAPSPGGGQGRCGARVATLVAHPLLPPLEPRAQEEAEPEGRGHVPASEQLALLPPDGGRLCVAYGEPPQAARTAPHVPRCRTALCASRLPARPRPQARTPGTCWWRGATSC
jgi:hypothetical protein